ncbi:methylated-DNA--[protein]-cysteine S-methyltransferase [Enterovirga rhinocerotis]|uniref:methylated-DNA--[protein]-cysteine S-methyltransferase n=1 Tax=Enterovirga rhinocerotis TaxID=1339210 RepID=A0A4R7C7P6_9HYPH|nr:methylated-DNA--[protein]-cysteine S-methyltransferase [Enterovirga rhinocerotis]TDR93255.1 methylated-DNA-[protein]-cysteine S-methyltransferase [Enterovirga rhinocerotis]
MARRFALFETAIGTIGLVWSERGLVGLRLPEGDEAATRSELLRRFPDAVPASPDPATTAAIEAIRALVGDGRRDLSHLPLDWDGVPDFDRRVYDVLLTIPPGETMTYGEMARRIGEPGAARAVGAALGRNPIPVVVPCHRVLAAGGRIGGFSAPGGAETKHRLLAIERAAPDGQPSLF